MLLAVERSSSVASAAVFDGDARRGEVWVFDEPADPATLSHSAADLRLVSPEAALAEARDPAFSALAADPARLARLLPGVALEPALPTAEDVAATSPRSSSPASPAPPTRSTSTPPSSAPR